MLRESRLGYPFTTSDETSLLKADARLYSTRAQIHMTWQSITTRYMIVPRTFLLRASPPQKRATPAPSLPGAARWR